MSSRLKQYIGAGAACAAIATAILWAARPGHRADDVPVVMDRPGTAAASAVQPYANIELPMLPQRIVSEPHTSLPSNGGVLERYLRVVVTDQFDEPIINALCTTSTNGTSGAQATAAVLSDNTGTAVLPVSAGYGDRLQLWVSAEGFVPIIAEVARGEGREAGVHIWLKVAGTIEGYVVDAHGNGFTRPSSVVAIPDGSTVDLVQLITAGVSPIGTGAAPTDAFGHFVIGQLDPDLSYSLKCGAPGFMLADPVVNVRTDKSLINLTLLPLFGCLLEFRDENGNVPSVGAEVYSAEGFSSDITQGDGETRNLTRQDLALAGLELQAHDVNGWKTMPLFAVAPEESAQLRMTVDARIPGFRAFRSEFTLPRVTSAVATVVGNLGAPPPGIGDVRLICRDMPATVADVTGNPALGLVRLKRDDGLLIELRIAGWAEESLLLLGIPSGRYESATLEASFKLWSAPLQMEPVSGILEPGGTLSLSAPTTDAAGIELDVRDPVSGESINSPVTLQVMDEHGHSGGAWLARPPYVVWPLLAGSYRLRMVTPFSASQYANVEFTAEVSPATIKTVQLVPVLRSRLK